MDITGFAFQAAVDIVERTEYWFAAALILFMTVVVLAFVAIDKEDERVRRELWGRGS